MQQISDTAAKVHTIHFFCHEKLEGTVLISSMLPTDSEYVTRDGTYSQEKHAVHGKRGVARVEGKPARKEKHRRFRFPVEPGSVYRQVRCWRSCRLKSDFLFILAKL